MTDVKVNFIRVLPQNSWGSADLPSILPPMNIMTESRPLQDQKLWDTLPSLLQTSLKKSLRTRKKCLQIFSRWWGTGHCAAVSWDMKTGQPENPNWMPCAFYQPEIWRTEPGGCHLDWDIHRVYLQTLMSLPHSAKSLPLMMASSRHICGIRGRILRNP